MTTVNSYNFKQVTEIIDLVRSMDIQLLGIQRFVPIGRGVGFKNLALTPNGDMLPCCKLPISLGNIMSMDFHDAWNSEIMNEFRSCHNLKGKCGRCVHREICRGCRAAAYATYGDWLAEDPQCWMETFTKDL